VTAATLSCGACCVRVTGASVSVAGVRAATIRPSASCGDAAACDTGVELVGMTGSRSTHFENRRDLNPIGGPAS
jgi:hypothetical protein